MVNTKRIITNIGSLIIAELGSQIIGFLLVAIIARQLGVEAFGKYSLALAYATLFSIFIELGTSKILIREVARHKAESAPIVANILAIRILAIIPTLATMMLVMVIIGYTTKIYELTFLAGIHTSLSLLLMALRMWFQGHEQMMYDAFSRLFERSLATILGTIFLISGLGIYWVFYALLISVVLTLIIFFYISVRHFGSLSVKSVSTPQMRVMVGQSLPLLLSGVLVTIYFRVDTLMISIFRDEAAVGFYNAAYNIILSLSLVSQIYNHAIFPTLVSQHTDNPTVFENNTKHGLRYLMMLGFPMTAGVIVLADQFIRMLYGSDFNESGTLLQLLAVVLLLMMATSYFGNIFIIQNKQKLLTLIALFNAIFNVLLNLLLIPQIGARGAAIATVTTELFGLCIYAYIFYRIIHLNPWHSNIFRIAIATAIMSVVVYLVSPMGLGIGIIVGMLVYPIALLGLGGILPHDITLIKQLRNRQKVEAVA